MNHWIKRCITRGLVAFGRPQRLEYYGLLIELEHWLKAHQPQRRYESRKQMYTDLNNEVLRNRPVDYLEFGVWQGDTILHWAAVNQESESRFFGFDSFEGLPEAWGKYDQGHFSTKGRTPDSADPRVVFVKGWFQQTLPGFLKDFRPCNRLVVHIDADLYSSTLYVLATLHPILEPGTVLIFDEFYDCLHEFRAFRDYTAAFRRDFKPLFSTTTDKQVSVELG